MDKTNKATINEAGREPPARVVNSLVCTCWRRLANYSSRLSVSSVYVCECVCVLSRFVTTAQGGPSPGRTWTLVVVFVIVEWPPSLSSLHEFEEDGRVKWSHRRQTFDADGLGHCCCCCFYLLSGRNVGGGTAVTSRWISNFIVACRFGRSSATSLRSCVLAPQDSQPS